MTKYINCYEKCEHYFYYDELTDKNYCTQDSVCPHNFDKLIKEKNKCIDECKYDDDFRFEFRKKCYKQCPEDTEGTSNFYCNVKCPKERPFELILTQICINNTQYLIWIKCYVELIIKVQKLNQK